MTRRRCTVSLLQRPSSLLVLFDAIFFIAQLATPSHSPLATPVPLSLACARPILQWLCQPLSVYLGNTWGYSRPYFWPYSALSLREPLTHCLLTGHSYDLDVPPAWSSISYCFTARSVNLSLIFSGVLAFLISLPPPYCLVSAPPSEISVTSQIYPTSLSIWTPTVAPLIIYWVPHPTLFSFFFLLLFFFNKCRDLAPKHPSCSSFFYRVYLLATEWGYLWF